MPGSWRLKVLSKKSPYPNRFIVIGAKSGSGVYGGKKGKKVTVESKKKWILRIESKLRRRKWRGSKHRLAQNSKKSFTIESEGDSNNDFNDLIVRGVKLKKRKKKERREQRRKDRNEKMRFG